MELEGSEAFIAKYLDELREYVSANDADQDAADDEAAKRARPVKRVKPAESPANETDSNVPKNLGEFLNEFEGLPQQHAFLVAAYWFQMTQSEANNYKVAEVSSALIEVGVKIGNPSMANKGSVGAKRAYSLGGKSYRVSKDGEKFIAALRSGESD